MGSHTLGRIPQSTVSSICIKLDEVLPHSLLHELDKFVLLNIAYRNEVDTHLSWPMNVAQLAQLADHPVSGVSVSLDRLHYLEFLKINPIITEKEKQVYYDLTLAEGIDNLKKLPGLQSKFQEIQIYNEDCSDNFNRISWLNPEFNTTVIGLNVIRWQHRLKMCVLLAGTFVGLGSLLTALVNGFTYFK